MLKFAFEFSDHTCVTRGGSFFEVRTMSKSAHFKTHGPTRSTLGGGGLLGIGEALFCGAELLSGHPPAVHCHLEAFSGDRGVDTQGYLDPWQP